MVKFNFDEVIERRSTDALKWIHYDPTIIPLWVADSDFKCAPAILKALHERIEHGVLGYHVPVHNESATDAVVSWLSRRYHWQIEAGWVVWVPGVVTGFNGACRAFCQTGDKVLVQEPNYGPLLNSPEFNNLQKETIGTYLVDNRWTINLDELATKAADPKARMFILCNPMNPCGSVLTHQELKQIEEICLENNVLLCSDEIHSDLILDKGLQHIPAGSLSDIGSKCITLMAASKTFNIAGLAASFAIIPDKKIRDSFVKTTLGMQLWVNSMGMIATEKAFTECDDWYDAQLDYLRANRDYLVKAFSELDGFSYIPSAATYLAWIDGKGLGTDDVHEYMLSKGVGPTPGSDFGWPSYTRINYACPRSYLEQAIARLTPN